MIKIFMITNQTYITQRGKNILHVLGAKTCIHNNVFTIIKISSGQIYYNEMLHFNLFFIHNDHCEKLKTFKYFM